MGGSATAAVPFAIQSLDGSGNNAANPAWGQSGRPYARVAAARYADGRSQPVAGPNARMISNRVFSDVAQNIFSSRQLDAWGWTWGQFLDHTFGLRQSGTENENIPFNAADPLEQFRNDLGTIAMQRSAAASGTGATNPRQQINTESNYIDSASVYSSSPTRLDWLREGSVDGNPTNNSARLLLQNNYLPRKTARGNAAAAPAMDVDGILLANPNSAMVAGDVRANENLFLTTTHTLFAREHNRIVASLPASLSEEDKFQIARRVVIAEQQFITYNEWLPAMGVSIPAYSGYKNNVDATLSNEFATVGYRAHSQIHGEMEIEAEADTYTQAQLDAFEAQGLEVTQDGGEVAIVIPLNKGFFNPDLVPNLQLGPLAEAIGAEAQYSNDEMIDNQLRSVLFKVPNTTNPDCLDGPTLPQCFNGVTDLGAIDIERARDHGMPTYNQMRQAYGLPAVTSFTQITGEASQTFPAGTGVNTPNSLDFTQLRDPFNTVIDPADDVRATTVVSDITRRTPIAARLAAIYGNNVNNVEAFVGMVAEKHVAGSEFGPLQRAMWTREFTRLRDGDRFFFGNDPGLTFIRNTYGIDFRSNLGDIISRNADIPRAELPSNVFFTHGDNPPTSCRVTYTVTNQWDTGFQVSQNITNTGSVPITNWTERFTFANGQQVTQLWNGVVTQDQNRVPAQNASWNAVINPGQTIQDVGFTATRTGSTNARPTAISLNTTACSIG
ncbi:MAG: peroxidase family protein [Labedaea sp.]